MNDLVRTLPCREEGPRTGSQCCDHPADLWGFVGICFRSRAVLSSCVMWMEAGAVWAEGGRGGALTWLLPQFLRGPSDESAGS